MGNADVQLSLDASKRRPVLLMPHRLRPERRSGHGQNDLEATGNHVITSPLNR
jgi:hypothetical protein